MTASQRHTDTTPSEPLPQCLPPGQTEHLRERVDYVFRTDGDGGGTARARLHRLLLAYRTGQDLPV